MKAKGILFLLICLFAFSSQAQFRKLGKEKTKVNVTEFKITMNDLNELNEFDWKMVDKVFKTNNKSDNITLALAYMNESEPDESSEKMHNFEIKVTGKTEDLDDLKSQVKASFLKMSEFQRQKLDQ